MSQSENDQPRFWQPTTENRRLNSMIIGFDASRAFVNKRTGTENYSYQLLTHLAKIDHENTYKVFLHPGIFDPNQLKGWPANFKFLRLNYKFLWTQVGLAGQTFIDHLDLLFVPSHTLPLVRKPGLKTVMTVHDLGAEYLPQTHQLKQQLYLKLMTYYQLKSAAHLIAVSEATKRDITKKAGIPADKISVIYEGYDEKLFHPLKNDALIHSLTDYNLLPKTYFLFVGTIQPRKNLEQLIKAYALFLNNRLTPDSQHPDQLQNHDPTSIPELVLAGSRGWLTEDIYSLPAKFGIGTRVKFLGYVPDKILPALYGGAIAFFFPSLYEGFGLPVLEAMACGTPVITSGVSSLPEVGGKAALYVDPNSTEEISRKMVLLASNHIPGATAAKKRFDQVKKFSWDKCAAQTLKLFQKIASE